MPANRALFDDTIYDWHREAAGYKIRHVPATLPDILKTREVVLWEYRETLGDRAPQAFDRFEAQLAHLRKGGSDFEIAMPLDQVASFAAGSGYWHGLPAAARLHQIDRLIDLSTELYPALRLYFFDAHKVFSAPMTVFGPHRAVIYIGRAYLALNDAAKVAEMSLAFRLAGARGLVQCARCCGASSGPAPHHHLENHEILNSVAVERQNIAHGDQPVGGKCRHPG